MIEKKKLLKIGTAFNIGDNDQFAVELKRNFWYYTFDKKFFWGPFRNLKNCKRDYEQRLSGCKSIE